MTREGPPVDGAGRKPDVANVGLARPPLVYLASIGIGAMLEFIWPLPFLPHARPTWADGPLASLHARAN